MEVMSQYKMMGNRPRKSGRSKRFMFCVIGDASARLYTQKETGRHDSRAK